MVHMMNDIYTIAIDQAEKCGWAIFKGSQLIKHGVVNFESKNNTYETKIHNIKQWFKNIIKEEKIAIIVFEDVFLRTGFGGKPIGIDKYAQLNKLLGVLENYCVENELFYWISKASEWRSNCGIKTKDGRKSIKREELKASAMKFVKDKFGLDVGEDECEAICIGYSFVNNEMLKIIS